jgi:hypothetical protein
MSKPKKKPRLHTHIFVVDKKTYGMVPTVNLIKLAVRATGLTVDAKLMKVDCTKNARFVVLKTAE